MERGGGGDNKMVRKRERERERGGGGGGGGVMQMPNNMKPNYLHVHVSSGLDLNISGVLRCLGVTQVEGDHTA